MTTNHTEVTLACDPTPQQKISKAFRALADWYDEHPNAPVDIRDQTRVRCYFKATPEQIRSIGPGEKEYSDDLFYYHVKGDGFAIRFYTNRETVCERKLVGYKETPEVVLPATPEYIIPAKKEPIYEYDCKSILAPEVS
jgi:hypothetical protein